MTTARQLRYICERAEAVSDGISSRAACMLVKLRNVHAKLCKSTIKTKMLHVTLKHSE